MSWCMLLLDSCCVSCCNHAERCLHPLCVRAVCARIMHATNRDPVVHCNVGLLCVCGMCVVLPFAKNDQPSDTGSEQSLVFLPAPSCSYKVSSTAIKAAWAATARRQSAHRLRNFWRRPMLLNLRMLEASTSCRRLQLHALVGAAAQVHTTLLRAWVWSAVRLQPTSTVPHAAVRVKILWVLADLEVLLQILVLRLQRSLHWEEDTNTKALDQWVLW
jgi:hypothetical protein